MSYLALYRKYRPTRLDDVSGQETITRILKNQIMTDRIGHAYLFSGIRGTGKTTIAKIFARAVNCEDPVDGNPCGVCDTCKALSSPAAMDIIEIDAASNRGVDEIRELRDKIDYPPNWGKYKVYIIDEAHMLTKEAFNALLKTLEEPPEHAMFIFATTEPTKLPDTILSRCQKYSVKPIENRELVKRMREICDQEGVRIEDAAVEEIAFRADHSMRDGLSLLDQCIDLRLPGELITLEDVSDFLGTPARDDIEQIAKAQIENDPKTLVATLERIRKSGKEDRLVLEDVANFYKNLLYYKITGDKNKNYSEIFEELSPQISTERINQKIDKLVESHNKLRFNVLTSIITDTCLLSLVGESLVQEEVPAEILTQDTDLKRKEFNVQEFREALINLAHQRNLELISILCESADFKLNKNGLFIILDDDHAFMFHQTDFKRNLHKLVVEVLGENVKVYPKLKSKYLESLQKKKQQKKGLEEHVREVIGDLEVPYVKED